MQEEEAGQSELLDQHELFLESLANAFLVAVQSRVALDECVLANAAQLHDRRLHPVGEVGIAIAELLCQIEPQTLCELARACNRIAVVWKTFEHVGRRGENGLVVASALALAAVERRAATDGNEDVLERRSTRVMCVHVAGRDRLHLQHLREIS